MTKKVTERDVLAFIEAAPTKVLRKIKIRLDEKIREGRNDECQSAIADAIKMTNFYAEMAPMPMHKDSDLDDDLKSTEEMMTGLVKNVDTDVLKIQLKAELEKAEKSNTFVFDAYEAELVFMFKDKQENGLFKISNDPDLTQIFTKLKLHCDSNNLYCPYGTGLSKDLLKVKSFVCSNKGDKVRVTIKLVMWNYNGKSGYTCYRL